MVALASCPLVIITTGAFVAGGLLAADHSDWAPTVFIVATFFLIFTIVAPLGVVAEQHAQRRNDEACNADCVEWKGALKDICNPTIRELAVVNFKQLRKHVTLAQAQVRHSFYASLAAATVALLVLASGTAATLVRGGTSSKVTGTILTGAGLALSGFLTATFVKTYQMASRQMSYYYGQPLVHCYLLQAEWLADVICKFDQMEGRAAWRAVLDEALQAAWTAHDHLLSLNEDQRSAKRHRKRRRPAAADETVSLADVLTAVLNCSRVSNGKEADSEHPTQGQQSASKVSS